MVPFRAVRHTPSSPRVLPTTSNTMGATLSNVARVTMERNGSARAWSGNRGLRCRTHPTRALYLMEPPIRKHYNVIPSYIMM